MKVLTKRVLRALLPERGRNTAVVIGKSDQAGQPDVGGGTTFTHDGVTLPITPDHRGTIKAWWKYYGPCSALDELRRRGLLDPASADFLRRMTGGRTLGHSLDEARDVLAPFLDRHRALFLTTAIPDLEKRPVRPEESEVQRWVAAASAGHQKMLARLSEQGLVPTGRTLRVLEIGYTSGGISAFGWEECGLDAHAIDYFFGDTVESISRHAFIADMIGSKVQFHLGDVTRHTGLPDGHFDLIYSSSTIEHIADLAAAFAEMVRLLRPGGLAVHRYDPFFHPAGGHSLATLDTPWGHVRVSKAGLDAYIRALRPFEAPVAASWVENALHPTHTQAHVQRSITQAGLLLREWRIDQVDKTAMAWLTADIVTDALHNIAGLSIQDLVTRNVFFVAQKEE